MAHQELTLTKGMFMFSLDVELAWGTRGRPTLIHDYEATRAVIDRLLALLEKYQLKATWAVLGHLFLDSCQPEHGTKHPEIKRPPRAEDWFSIDPAGQASQHPLWYAPDVVRKILNCSIAQEIGSHSFSHITSEEYCTSECFDSEIKACLKAAEAYNTPLVSFVFPKNIVKHLDILRANGFKVFRGPDQTWYRNTKGIFRKLFHGIDNYLVVPSPSVTPVVQDGLINVPGSYFYVHRKGWARLLPISFRVAKVKAGIDAAIKKKQVFHLWCHPFNLASDPEGLLAGLESIFSYVRGQVDKGFLDNKTMGQLSSYSYIIYD